jgi:hypothetical protein
MNTPFKAVSGSECSIRRQQAHGDPAARKPGNRAMLILIVTAAVLGALGLELMVHRIENTYEIEWVGVPEQTAGEMAREIAQTLRKALERDGRMETISPCACPRVNKSERQMNGAFKVASGAHW